MINHVAYNNMAKYTHTHTHTQKFCTTLRFWAHNIKNSAVPMQPVSEYLSK